MRKCVQNITFLDTIIISQQNIWNKSNEKLVWQKTTSAVTKVDELHTYKKVWLNAFWIVFNIWFTDQFRTYWYSSVWGMSNSYNEPRSTIQTSKSLTYMSPAITAIIFTNFGYDWHLTALEQTQYLTVYMYSKIHKNLKISIV